MIDKTYFETVLLEQFRAIRHGVTLTVRLHDGSHFNVWRLGAIHDGYVALEIHTGHEPRRGADHHGPDQWVFDHVTVPYENISSIQLSTRPGGDSQGRPIGFHHDAT
jgi:hypothetical protein